MARFEKQSPTGSKPNAGVKPAAPARPTKAASIEDTMFFPKLRRHARWMFVFLALLIGGGLVIAGVGAGGVGVLDVFRGSSGSGTSVSSAKDKTEKNPADVQAWRDLAIAYQTDGKNSEAVSALQTASSLKPKDTSILRELAAAQLATSTEKQQEAQLVQYQGAFAAPSDPSGGLQVKGQNALGTDKIQAAVASTYTTRLTEAYNAATAAANGAVSTYKKIVAIEKDDPNVQLELAQAAESAGDTASAITAYEAFLKLAPDDSSASIVKNRLKQLKPSTTGSGK
jgi:Flp pilus assembly protein TadD